jgi:hypothetical protein
MKLKTSTAKQKHICFNPFSTEPVLQIMLLSLAQMWVHSYAITCWTKQAMDANFQLWIDKMATFNLTPRGITSDLASRSVASWIGQNGHCLGGSLQELFTNVLFISTGLARTMQGGPIHRRRWPLQPRLFHWRSCRLPGDTYWKD